MPARLFSALRLGAFATLLVGAAVAAACGDDDDTTTPTSAPTSGASSSPSAAATRPAQSASATTSSAAAEKAVTIADNSFSPASLTVAKGTKVVWNWTGQNPHSVAGTSANAKALSSTTQASGKYEFTFDTPGTYQYQCGVHGAAMSGTVVVQ